MLSVSHLSQAVYDLNLVQGEESRSGNGKSAYIHHAAPSTAQVPLRDRYGTPPNHTGIFDTPGPQQPVSQVLEVRFTSYTSGLGPSSHHRSLRS
jgi:hypothetical protein